MVHALDHINYSHIYPLNLSSQDNLQARWCENVNGKKPPLSIKRERHATLQRYVKVHI